MKGSKGGGDKGEKPKAADKLERVGVSDASERLVRDALHRSASSDALVGSRGRGSFGGGGSGGGGSSQSLSEMIFAAASEGADELVGSNEVYHSAGGDGGGGGGTLSRSLHAPAPGSFDLPTAPGIPRPSNGVGASRLGAQNPAAAAAVSRGAPPPTGKKPRDQMRVPDGPPPPPGGGGMGPMGVQRRSLPVYSFRDRLIQTVGSNRVCVVEGDTGSGKTTQVPQFLLEDACERWGRGRDSKGRAPWCTGGPLPRTQRFKSARC